VVGAGEDEEAQRQVRLAITVNLLSERGWPYVLAIVGGLLVTMLVGVVVGIAALRTRGMTLAIVTPPVV
jgi:sulfate-transporting ATPase